MAGKSGRTINHIPENPVKKAILSWEGILVLVLIGINIFCANFSEVYNAFNLLRQMPYYLAEVFLMLGMAFILVMGEIDISVGSIVCLSATVACFASNAGIPFPLVFAISLLVGMACGMINGFILTTFPELPPMIVTLSTQIIYRGIAEVALGSGGSLSVNDTAGFKAIAGKVAGKYSYIMFLVLILVIIAAIILGKSTFGRKVYAIGTNRVTAFYSGINVQRIRFILYTALGVLSGLCAMFLISSSYGVNTTSGTGYEMDAIAMAVFGGISSTGGKGTITGGILSALAIVCLRVGLGQRNVNAQVILLILGVLLIMAVAIPNVVGSIRKSMKKPQ